MNVQHVINISGGKDSTACYLLALLRGKPFRPVMSDTGNEHPINIEYADWIMGETNCRLDWIPPCRKRLERPEDAP